MEVSFLANVIEKRYSLHKRLAQQERLNSKLESQISQIQPLANIGVVSAMIAHEMNNILTPLGSYAELALKNPQDKELALKTIKKTAINSARAAKILESVLAMAGGKLKEAGTIHWEAPNVGATNESGFTALPVGTRTSIGTWGSLSIGNRASWWTSTLNDPDGLTHIGIWRGNDAIFDYQSTGLNYKVGYSIRCLRD